MSRDGAEGRNGTRDDAEGRKGTEQWGRVAPNMVAGGSHPQATSDSREEEAEERRKGTRRPRWADCEDDERKEEEEQETERERQQETKEKKEQEKEKETRPETGYTELTSEKPPGLEQWVKSEHSIDPTDTYHDDSGFQLERINV